MKKLLNICLLLSFVGCGKTICDQAADKLSSCNLGQATVNGACDARSQCESQCILNASCADLQAAFTGQTNSYTACDDSCKTR
jgi:hypothetical protein